MSQHPESRSRQIDFVYKGGGLPRFSMWWAIKRSTLIALSAVVIAEVAVFGVYWLMNVENTLLHAQVTLAATVLVAFPMAFYFSIQRFKLTLAIARLDRYARYDGLSGLFNRTTFVKQAQLRFAHPDADAMELSVLFMDGDHFKLLNDTYGHATGDRAIEAIGESIVGCLRPEDLAGRMGGEEFCVLLVGQDAASAELTARCISDALRTASDGLDVAEPISLSMGLATRRKAEGFSRVCSRADQALYEAKEAGRNRLVRHSANGRTLHHLVEKPVPSATL